MRFPTLLLAVITCLTAGCLGEVGGDRKPGVGSGSGSDETPDEKPTGACEKVDRAVMIRVPADMELLPRTGCYDIVGKLTIQSPQITSLAQLKDLTSVGELELDHTGLTTIDSKLPINLYGRLTVTGNAQLKDLKQLQLATAPTGVVIDDNDALTTLDALTLATPAFTEVNGDLSITGNAALPAITLPNLAKVRGLFQVGGNLQIASLDLSKLATTYGIELGDNPALVSVTGLAATLIAGDLAIYGNTKLTTIGAMGALVQVTGDLTIDGNAALTTLAAFTTSMKRIDQTLRINNNASLTDLGMLKHLDSVNAVSITNNRNLSVCRAIEIDRCVSHTVASQITNNRDASNCNSSSCD